MIVDGLFLILGFLVNVLCFLLPTGQVWPDSIQDGISYFVNQFSSFNNVFPVDTLFTAMIFFVNFLIYYLSAKILFKFFNWLRGAGGI